MERRNISLPSPPKSSILHCLDFLERRDTMKHALLLLTAAALVAGTALTGSAVAQDRSRHTELTANQMADQGDAQSARIKAELLLTPDQEKNWAGFESAMRDIGKKRADREISRRAELTKQKGPVDVI